MKRLSCYYLDEPLSPDEREFAEETLLGLDARFRTGALEFEERRIPNVLPVPGKEGLFSKELTEHLATIKKNLRKAGIRGDGGVQVLFVLPQSLQWGSLFQMAIYEETGFYPYTLQRWYYDGDKPERREARILDGHGLIGGKGGSDEGNRR